MTSALLTGLFATLALAVSAQSVALARLWRRARATGPDPEVGRRLDDLAARLAALEARPIAPAPAHPTGPRRSTRVDRGGPTLIAVPDLSTRPNPAPDASADLGRRFGAVWALVDAGAPAEVVARETGYPAGQVELILGLRRRLQTGDGPAGAGPDA